MKQRHIDPDTQQAIRRFVEKIEADFRVAGVILYGSRARGEHRTDSDADVAVLLDGEPGKILKTTLTMTGPAHEVLLETGINISPLPVWKSQWENPETHPNPDLLRTIAREWVLL